MNDPADVLDPGSFRMLDAIARAGSGGGAARELGLVPSALTYRVRQIEDALDVLLFDRSSRQARPTPAGAELLAEGGRLKREVDAVVRRVKRVATGWEPELRIAADGALDHGTLIDLCCDFFDSDPPTRLSLREEILSGTLAALTDGEADLALGVTLEPASTAGLRARPLGRARFVYAVAPDHPLAQATEPIGDAELLHHRAIVIADSARDHRSRSFGLLAGQPTFTVSSLQAKLDAQLRGLGAGFLPEALARPHLQAGRLVARRIERGSYGATLHYAWRASAVPGRALSWWLERLERPVTRRALLEGRASV